MKRAKKVLVGLLAILSVLLGSLGLVACGESESSSNKGEATDIEKVYAQYVVYAEAQGQEPLSYEEWLASIKGEQGEQGIQGEKGEKGEKGDTGAQGEKGEKGDTGAQGVGIEKVEYDENGDLKITFTDGATQTIVMPDKHVHTFGEWTAFTADDVPCENRLFFRVCTECNGVEWKQGSYNDHDFTTVTTEPTCQAGGYDTKTCEICGKVETVNPTEKVGHAWATEYSFDNSYHWIDCDTCDEFKDKQEHSVLSSGECSVCNELVGATEGIVYDVSNGEAQVVMYEGTATRVRIAETYQGAPVTKIANEAFECSAITSIVIPDSVTTIGYSAFYDCDSLTSIEIPDSVTSIGESAFTSCGSLTSITIPDSVTSIGNYAFDNCDSLTSVTIGENVTSIGESAFTSCGSLTSIVIPDSVTSIGEQAFYGCSGLTSIEIPDSVTSIGYGAFAYCGSLTSVVIGDSVTSIGDSAFYDCDNLKFNEYGNAKYLGSKTNDYFALIETKSKNFSSYTIHNDTILIADEAFYDCDSLTSIEIPDSVTSIGEQAFYGCSGLTSIEIPDSVTSIGNEAFYHCYNLTSVVIPDSVTSIGYWVFADCSSLTSVVIGNGVTSIGNYAFSSCENLTSITFNGTKAQWNAVEKGNYWNNNFPATKVVCSDGEVEI